MFKDRMTSLDEALGKKALPRLETFPCPYDTARGSHGIIRIVFPEFTCLCPRTGYPDFAAIRLWYLPKMECLELKSWKLYLNAFRMVGAFHEALTAHLFHTLCGLLEPEWLLLAGDFFPRGNVDTTVVFETQTPRPQGAELVIDIPAPRCRGFDTIAP